MADRAHPDALVQAGLNLIGCDLLEVSPPYDPTGNTALIAANLLFEMLCIVPGKT